MYYFSLIMRELSAWRLPMVLCVLFILGYSSPGWAHGVAVGDKGFIQDSSGVMVLPFVYLGAKHMMTGYDHLLFLLGVVFYLCRLKDVALYVTLFAVGHSVTLLSGVLSNVSINAYIIDAIIGFSVVYKALDNLGAFKQWFGFQPSTLAATLVFGLIHGFGLATKIQDFSIAQDGLVVNLLAFNLGVELGQLLALSAILILLGFWRLSAGFQQQAYRANVALMMLGFLLIGYQISGFVLQS